jgi:hypothetical protein
MILYRLFFFDFVIKNLKGKILNKMIKLKFFKLC